MKKTYGVVMLPTEKAETCLGLIQCIKDFTSMFPEDSRKVGALSWGVNISEGVKEFWRTQHLYFTSNDEIKEGDWFITSVDISKYSSGFVHKCKSRPKDNTESFNWVSTEEFTFKPENCKKIVTATDKSLKIGGGTGRREDGISIPLPQIHESFILIYFKAYNEGKPITEVDLEMEYTNLKLIGNNYKFRSIDYKLKTRDDNTVIIHKSKVYSRDEVIELMFATCQRYITTSMSQIEIREHFDEWIQNNLK